MSNEMVVSERFANNVVMQYTSEVGKNSFGEYEKMLMQHLFIKIDFTLKELMSKTNYKTGKPVYPDLKWDNINMAKLALDSVNRIQLGLDGLINNHIHPIAYKNSNTGKYDIDLRIGYEGKLYYRQSVSIEPIKDIRIEIVYDTDRFAVFKKSVDIEVENYAFEVTDPFNRGNVRGGFGYIEYENKKNNKLILVTLEDIKRSKDAAKTDTFWKSSEIDMIYKTIVHRTADKIKIDPKKVNKSFFEAENVQYEEVPEEKEIIDIADDNKIEVEQEDVKDIPIEYKQTENNIIEPGF